MNKTEALKTLKSLGTAQNRKVYARHGVAGDLFGVSFADLRKLGRKIGTDQSLAEQLWASGNFDARILAALVADADGIKKQTLNLWAREADCYPLAHELAALTARTAHARDRMAQWCKARDDLTACVGWHLLAVLAGQDGGRPDSEFAMVLKQIEAGIEKAGVKVSPSAEGLKLQEHGQDVRYRNVWILERSGNKKS